jgi:hypothetical protein
LWSIEGHVVLVVIDAGVQRTLEGQAGTRGHDNGRKACVRDGVGAVRECTRCVWAFVHTMCGREIWLEW